MLKQAPETKPLWLWGGADLCRNLAEAGLVDGMDIAVIPVVLGGGIPLVASPAPRLSLQLRKHRLYRATGTMYLEYDVRQGKKRKAKKSEKGC